MRGPLLGLPQVKTLKNGWAVRLLSAREELEAGHEGETLVEERGDRALCDNACLLAHALLRNGKSAFASGAEVLEALTAGQIEVLARRWAEFDRECDPGPWDERVVAETKKAWSTRLMSAFSGVCSRLLGRCLPRRE